MAMRELADRIEALTRCELAKKADYLAVHIAPLGRASGATRWEAAKTLRKCAAALRAMEAGDDE